MPDPVYIPAPCGTCGRPSGVSILAGQPPPEILPPVVYYCPACWASRNVGRKTFRSAE